jgi:hypothetical protein
MSWIKNQITKAGDYAAESKKQRWFGVLLIAVAGLAFWFRDLKILPTALTAIGVIAITLPKVIRPILFVWMLLGGILAEIGSTILLTVIYYIIAWPLKFAIKKPTSGWHDSEKSNDMNQLY